MRPAAGTAGCALLALCLASAPDRAAGSGGDGLQQPARRLDQAAPPQDWLDRMNAAIAARAFSGTLVFLRDGQLDALRIEHAPDAGAGRPSTRLSSLSGENIEVASDREALRLRSIDGHSTWSSLDGHSIALSPRQPPPAHYELVLAGEDRVAGRQTQVLDIRPRDGFRYGHRLWLDADSALVLKALTIGPDGRAVEQLMFTELTLQPGVEDVGTPVASPAVASPAVVDRAWQVLDAPAGYTPRWVDDGPASHLLFSDGVAFVSVYVEPLSSAQPTLSGAVSRGALNAFGRVAHGRQIIAMGEAPAAAIERFAQGVVPIEGGRSATR